jgi:hypothetical protein
MTPKKNNPSVNELLRLLAEQSTEVSPEVAASRQRNLEGDGYMHDVLGRTAAFMLPTAEVEASNPIMDRFFEKDAEGNYIKPDKFTLPGQESAWNAYKNLGSQGVFDMQRMTNAVRSGRDKFAEKYGWPVMLALAGGAMGAPGAAGSGAQWIDDIGNAIMSYARTRGRGSNTQTTSPQPKMRTIKRSEKPDPMVARAAEQQGRDRLQNIADRAIRQADKEYHQDLFNTQRRIEQLANEGKIEWETAERLFQESVDDIFTQARIDDKILGRTERLDEMMGPTMRELYESDPATFDAIWYDQLIRPRVSRKIDGQVNPLMNEHGGRIRRNNG